MPSLRELQQSFLRGALYGDTDAVSAMILDDGIPSRERLGIYANNARENFVNTLEAAFPVVRALGGDDWFRQTAQVYWRTYPSRAGNLHAVGDRFAEYLHEPLATTAYAYFTEVARLEWAYQEALVAADHPGFDVVALQCVAPEDYGVLRFTLHPSVRLIASSYPILEVWRAHQPGESDLEHIDLTAGEQWLVVVRGTDNVQFRALHRATWTLLSTLSQRMPLAASTEAALAVDPRFDLAHALAQLMGLGVLADFSTVSEP